MALSHFKYDQRQIMSKNLLVFSQSLKHEKHCVKPSDDFLKMSCSTKYLDTEGLVVLSYRPTNVNWTHVL